jgi:hypothetical protein
LNKKGFSLALTLWIVAMMSLVSVLFLSYGKKIVQNSRDLETKLAVTIEAESFLEFLKFYGATAEIIESKIVNQNLKELFPSFPTILPIDSTKIVWKNKIFYLQDTAGLINITDIEAISNFIDHENELKDKKVIIQDSIKDWLDKDSIAYLNGAENNFYKNYKYNPRDSRYFAHPKELSLLRGIIDSNQTNIKRLLPNIYIFKRSSRNILTMDNDVLAHIYNFTNSDSVQLKKAKEESIDAFERLFFYLSDKKFNFERDSFMPSGAITITVSITDKNITKGISCMVDFISTKKRACEVWNYQD